MPEGGVEPSWLVQPLEQLGLRAYGRVTSLRVESPAQWRWGTADAAFLARVVQQMAQAQQEITIRGLPQELLNLLDLARAMRPADAEESAQLGFVARVGQLILDRAGNVRAFVNLMGQVVLLLPQFVAGRAKVRRSEMLDVLAESSSRALLIVGVVNILMGAILAFVGAVQLRAFGAGIYVADLVGIASARELTPILTAIVVAGRTGASFAARIATMQGNEEIDALTVLGVSAVEVLVLPRVVALSLLMPLLYVYGCVLALVGGLLVSMPVLDMSATAYLAQTQHAIGSAHFVIGGIKAFVFGGLVALVGCHYGLLAPRSAAGVGYATTAAVVSSIVGIIVLDSIFAVCANALDV